MLLPSGAQIGERERRAESDALPFSFFPPLPLPFPLQNEYLHPMFPYENLDVYNKAYSVNQVIYRLLKGNKSIPGYARDQLGRASLSIMLILQRAGQSSATKTGEIST